jgi:D-3-phosphoglycerate dehydrogenase / 2-oxoglutarate reductase
MGDVAKEVKNGATGLDWDAGEGALKVVVSDFGFEDLAPETEALRGVARVQGVREYPGREKFLALARDADGVISQMSPLDAAVMDGLKQCRVIVRYGVGVDNLDVAAATRNGIAVCNVPDYCTDDVADHTLTLMLGLIRKLPRSIDYLRAGNWNHNPLRPIRRLSSLTLGIYGFGRIARAVAERAKPFGFALIAHDPYVPAPVFEAAGVESVDADALLERSDVLALHMPLTDDTRGLLRRETFAKMKPGALVVNTARGGLIHTNELIEALDGGQIGGAALDVLDQEPIPADHPLWQRENVFMTGHLAWYSEEALRQLQRSVGEECARALRGETPRSVVNPEFAQNRRS